MTPDLGPERGYRIPPPDLASLIAEAHERARAIVADELVDQLVSAYRAALAAHFQQDERPAAPPEAETGRASAPQPAEQPAGDAERAWYVYVVGRAADLADIADLTGIDDEQVQVIRAGALAALATEPALAGFHAAEREPDLAEEGWLARALRTHDAVVASAFAAAPVLPMRFGSLYPRRDDVVAMLTSRADDLAAEIDRLATTAEWDVKAYVTTAEPATAGPAGSTDLPGGGTAWMQQRRDEAVARETAREERSRLAGEISRQLAEHARDVHLRSETAGHDPSQPALDAVYLVDRADQDGFLAVVDRLRDRHPDDVVRLTVTGPLPVYHFVQLDPAGQRHG